jgi:hemolysin D
MVDSAPRRSVRQVPSNPNPSPLISFPRKSHPATSTQTAPSIQTVLDQPASALPMRLALAGLAFSGIFAAWAWWGQINEVAHAQGKLVPQGETYKVNPSEAGKVAQVLVKEGESVKAGQVLMELDKELAQHDLEGLDKELTAAQTELGQVLTLLGQVHLQAKIQTTIAQVATQAQAAEAASAETNIRTTTALINQLNVDMAAQQARLDKLTPLVQAGAIAQEQLFQVEQSLRDRQRTITEHQGLLDRSWAEADRLAATLQQKQEEENKTRVEAQQQAQELAMRISQLQTKIAQTQTQKQSAQVKFQQRFVYAPVNGVVSTLKVRHQGEVVQPGQPLAEIAPSDQPLILTTLLPNQEAGFVKLGMPVQVKLDAYPYQDYGIIPGKVVAMSPDTQLDPQLGHVYRVEIALERSHITKDNQPIPFKAGQTALAEIVTRQRRIADILLAPLKQLGGGINL